MSTVLNSKAYDLLKEGPTATFGKKMKKIPVQIKSALLQMKNLKELLGTKQFFLHRLLEIRKTDIHFGLKFRFTGTFCHMLFGSFHNDLSPFTRKQQFLCYNSKSTLSKWRQFSALLFRYFVES